jgi:hypothetical protein
MSATSCCGLLVLRQESFSALYCKKIIVNPFNNVLLKELYLLSLKFGVDAAFSELVGKWLRHGIPRTAEIDGSIGMNYNARQKANTEGLSLQPSVDSPSHIEMFNWVHLRWQPPRLVCQSFCFH